MRGKHLRIKKTVIPCVVAAFMLLGNFTNVLAFGEFTGNVNVETSNVDEVIVTRIEPENNSSSSTELYKQTNFGAMREHLETQFGIITSRTGVKVGVLYQNRDGKADNSPSYFEALGNKETQTVYTEKINEIREIANETFDDVSSDDWFAANIPLAVYYTVLNGYDDMTFRGNSNITVAEISKVLAVACEGSDMDTSELSLAGLGTTWYNRYFNTISKAMPYTTSTEVTNDYMNKSMTRAEIAYTVAKIFDSGRDELQAYIDKANSGDIGGYFNDLSGDTVAVSEGTLDNEQWLMSDNKIPARFVGAIMYLKDKGIMLGDDAGNCNALSGVTRAEAVALVERIALKGVNYRSGQFTGAVNEGSSVVDPGEQQPVSKYTLDTVLNPDAPIEYQYKVSDLEEWGTPRNSILKGVYTGEQAEAKLAQTMLGLDYSQRIVDEVKNSVKYENGIVTFTLPDIKSDYHEIAVIIDVAYNDENKEGFSQTFRSWKDSGTITFDTKGGDFQCEMMIGVPGKSTYQQKSSPRYSVSFNFLTGEVESWTE